jgi:hypothetical protein
VERPSTVSIGASSKRPHAISWKIVFGRKRLASPFVRTAHLTTGRVRPYAERMKPRARIAFFRPRLLAAAWLAGLCGCYTLGIQETARTAPPGRREFGGGVTVVPVPPDQAGESGPSVVPFPYARCQFGVACDFELGLVWTFGTGLGASAKWRLQRRPVEVAVAVRATGFVLARYPFPSMVAWGVHPRLILSDESAGAFPYCLSAGVDMWGEASSGNWTGLSIGLGIPLRAGSRRQLRIMPEVYAVMVVASRGKLGSPCVAFGVSLSEFAPDPTP